METVHFKLDEQGRKVATYSLAGFNVEIVSVYKAIHRQCQDYVADGEPEIRIVTSEAEIEQERDFFANDDSSAAESSSYIESLLVYKKLCLTLVDHNILLMHGSCLAIDGNGVLFTAVSGTGKSTHTGMWRELFGDRVVMVNDDKPLVRVASQPIIYGTPWDGKHHLSTNTAVPLKAIVFLERGEDNEMHEVDAKEIFPILIQQTFRTEDMTVTMKVLELLSKLSSTLRFYNLHCNLDPEAARVAYNGIFK